MHINLQLTAKDIVSLHHLHGESAINALGSVVVEQANEIIRTLKEMNSYERLMQEIDEELLQKVNEQYGSERPWGRYDVLYNGEDCKIKRITVKPNKRLSLQSHNKRDEHWTIISGSGTVTINEVHHIAKPGRDFYIKRGELHRITNDSEENDLIFSEIQTGEYFGEDDIIRYEDDYGRN